MKYPNQLLVRFALIGAGFISACMPFVALADSVTMTGSAVPCGLVCIFNSPYIIYYDQYYQQYVNPGLPFTSDTSIPGMSYSVTYSANAYDGNGNIIATGTSLAPGTVFTLKFELPNPQFDSYTGHWSTSPNSAPDCSSADAAVVTKVYTYPVVNNLLQLLSYVNHHLHFYAVPPAESLTNLQNLSCEAVVNGSAQCTVTGSGPLSATLSFAATSAHLYDGYSYSSFRAGYFYGNGGYVHSSTVPGCFSGTSAAPNDLHYEFAGPPLFCLAELGCSWTESGDQGSMNYQIPAQTITLAFAGGVSSQPDLTAGAVAPTATDIGAATTLSAVVSNIGTATTGSAFTDLFQKATSVDANGNGAGVTDIGTYASVALAGGNSATQWVESGYNANKCVSDTCPANFDSVLLSQTDQPTLNTCSPAGQTCVYCPNGQGTFQTDNYQCQAVPATGSNTASVSYTFPSAGTYYIRACADKSSAGNAGVITESNENNNCGAWTAVTVSTTPSVCYGGGCTPTGGIATPGPDGPGSGSSCLYPGVTQPSSDPATCCASAPGICGPLLPAVIPTVILTATPSTILLGDGPALLTWTSQNATSCSGVSTDFAHGATSNITGAPVSPNTTATYSIVCNDGQGHQGTSNATVTVIAASLSLTASPAKVRKGEPSTISWNAAGSSITSCSVAGPGIVSSLLSGVQSTPINAESTYTFSCHAGSLNLSTSTTVKLIPASGEI